MDHLNSVLVEGIVVDDAKCTGERWAVFDLMSMRQYREGDEENENCSYGKGEAIRYESRIPIRLSLEKKGEVSGPFRSLVLKNTKAGVKARVVGRLREERGSVYVAAECIEWGGAMTYEQWAAMTHEEWEALGFPPPPCA